MQKSRSKCLVTAVSIGALLLAGCGGGGGGAAAPAPTTQAPSPVGNPAPAVPASFAPLNQALDANLPSATGSNSARSAAITSFDSMLWATDETKPTPTDVVDYYAARMARVAAELAQPVTTGFRVWAMYNHGFIVKTPTSTFAFDLVEGKGSWNSPAWTTQLPKPILDSIDVLLVSHEHGDHYDETERIPAAIKARGGSVVYPKITYPNPYGATPRKNTTLLIDYGQVARLGNLTVTAYGGLHNVPTAIYEVVTAEGYRIVHTGDNGVSVLLPALEGVDLLLLNGWLDNSATRPLRNSIGMKDALDKLRPAVMVPGHFQELAHPRTGQDGRYRYTDALGVQDSTVLRSKTVVLTWGERLDFTQAACTGGLVRIYSECKAPGSEPSDFVSDVFNPPELLAFNYPWTYSGIALTGPAIWLSVWDQSGGARGRLLSLGSSTQAQEANISAPGSRPDNLSFDGSALWLTDVVQGAQRIFKLSPAGSVLASFPVPPPTTPAYFAAGLAADSTRLFYAETIANMQMGGSRVLELDPNTGAVLRTVYTTSQHRITGLSRRKGGGLWVLSSLYVEGQGFTNKLIAVSDQGVELSIETPLYDSDALLSTQSSAVSAYGLAEGSNYLLWLGNGGQAGLIRRMSRF